MMLDNELYMENSDTAGLNDKEYRDVVDKYKRMKAWFYLSERELKEQLAEMSDYE